MEQFQINKGLETYLTDIFESVLDDIVCFSKLYDLKLEKVDETFERGFIEPIYYFSDERGGYTIDGIKRSIEEYSKKAD